MATRVPVLRQNHMGELGGQAIDCRNYLVALRHGERTTRTEIVLNIDDNEDVPVVAFH
jgi:hypothetical protein